MRVVIVPGNGGGNVEYANWYSSVRDDLSTNEHISEVVLRDMPDSYIARECYWIPFMRDILKCDESTIVIGHSSGAVAGMRYAESHRLAGISATSVNLYLIVSILIARCNVNSFGRLGKSNLIEVI
jgi:uncharacterized protein